MEESFARVETKYLLTAAQAAALEAGLYRQGFRRADFGSPRIQSLYYDTAEYSLIRASLERPGYKEKLRLRAYGEPGTVTRAYPEIKKKYLGVVYKRRTEMPVGEAMACLASGVLPKTAGQVGREIGWMLQRYSLRPAALISYDRDAWFSEREPGVRVTFDRNLQFRDWEPDLNSHASGILLLPPEQRLLEIKTGRFVPLWLAGLLRDVNARRTHFSKYGLAYQRYIMPEKEKQERDDSECSTVSLLMGA